MTSWRTVITWATAHGALASVLPMPSETFKTLVWDLGCFLPIIKGAVDSILARHRRFHLPSPRTGDQAYSFLMCSLSRSQGQ